MWRSEFGPQFRLEPATYGSNPPRSSGRPQNHSTHSVNQTSTSIALRKKDRQLEKEYMTNLQQQVYFLEMELQLMKRASVPKEKGLDINPDTPLDQVIFTLRERYDTMESHYKRSLRDRQAEHLRLQTELEQAREEAAAADAKLQDQIARRKKALSLAARHGVSEAGNEAEEEAEEASLAEVVREAAAALHVDAGDGPTLPVGAGMDPLDLLALLGAARADAATARARAEAAEAAGHAREEQLLAEAEAAAAAALSTQTEMRQALEEADAVRARLQGELRCVEEGAEAGRARMSAAEAARARAEEGGELGQLKADAAALRSAAEEAVSAQVAAAAEALAWKTRALAAEEAVSTMRVELGVARAAASRVHAMEGDLEAANASAGALEADLKSAKAAIARAHAEGEAHDRREAEAKAAAWSLERELTAARAEAATARAAAASARADREAADASCAEWRGRATVGGEELVRLAQQREADQAAIQAATAAKDKADAAARSATRERDLLRALCGVDPREMRALSTGAAQQLLRVGELYKELGIDGQGENSQNSPILPTKPPTPTENSRVSRNPYQTPLGGALSTLSAFASTLPSGTNSSLPG